MRLFVFLFFAVSLNAADIGSPIPFPRDEEGTNRANIQENTQPRQANTAKAITKAEAGCEKCGLACECGPGCECTADYWKDWCKAIPASQRAAYYRSLTARSVPSSAPFTQATPARGVANRSTSLTGQMWAGPIGIGVGIAGNRGDTSGCASGG